MITNGSKIQLVSPMGVFTNVGEVCEVIDINTYGGVVSISFKFGNGRHLGVMSFDEYQKYFKEYEEVETKPKRTWSDWEDDIFPYFNLLGDTHFLKVQYRDNGKQVELRTCNLENKNFKTKSTCHMNDKFNIDKGLDIADARMQIKLLENELDEMIKKQY